MSGRVRASDTRYLHGEIDVGYGDTAMARIVSKHLAEAEELLEEVVSWTEKEVERLPTFYREKAREYRKLANHGEA